MKYESKTFNSETIRFKAVFLIRVDRAARTLVTRTKLVFQIMMELIIVNVHRDIKRTLLVFVKTSMNVESIIGVNTDAPTPLVDGHAHALTD